MIHSTRHVVHALNYSNSPASKLNWKAKGIGCYYSNPKHTTWKLLSPFFSSTKIHRLWKYSFIAHIHGRGKYRYPILFYYWQNIAQSYIWWVPLASLRLPLKYIIHVVIVVSVFSFWCPANRIDCSMELVQVGLIKMDHKSLPRLIITPALVQRT